MLPKTKYAHSDDVLIAYQVTGEGPIDIVMAPGTMSHLDLIRAGLHSGEAIKHDDDFYGRTVVIAARISALALGGDLASALVYALARGLGTFTFGDPRTATLKGLDGSFDLRPVLG